MKTIAPFLFSVLLWAGCSREPVVQPIPPPPAAGEAVVLSGWSAVTNAAELAKVWHTGEGGPAAKFLAPGAVEMPVAFDGEKPPARANWDIKLPLDLTNVDGVQFDFFCDDLDQFSNFSFYFKSGDGWYNGTFEAEDNGVWQRVKVLKSQVSNEGKVGAWNQVTTLRLSGWRAGTGTFRCALANLAYLGGGQPDVTLVYAASLAAKGGGEGKSYLHFADTFAGTLRTIGLVPRIVGDTELTADMLKTASAVVLPYNPSFPADKLPLLKDHVAGGGRFLACYAQAPEVTDLLGLKIAGSKRPESDGLPAIAGFLKTGKGLLGQPDMAPQASWMTMLPVRAPGVDVVAEWASGDRKSLGIPALVRTRHGFFMSHVWLGGTDAADEALMRALVGELAPALGEKLARRAADEARRRDEQLAWLKAQPSRKGEKRAFWCHSARGLGGGRDWDASIKFLKENGFNTIIPNLAWGGIAFYPSKVLPVAKDVATRGDAFEQCRAACRKYGVEMHVWKVCWNMGHHTSEAYVKQMQAAGRTQVDVKGKAQERWLCPSHPDNQTLEIEAMVELAKMGPDGIHFDYIRYPGTDCCFCTGCRERFEAVLGAKVEDWPADVRDEKKLKKAWNEFRAANITKVVKTVSERVRKEAPGIQISAALFRSPSSDPETVAQNWPLWCREGYLDFACHMDYVNSTPLFRGQVRAQLKAAGKVPLYPGIGLSVWPNDGRAAERLAKQIQAARALGAPGFTVFNFDRHAELALPLLRLGVTKED